MLAARLARIALCAAFIATAASCSLLTKLDGYAGVAPDGGLGAADATAGDASPTGDGGADAGPALPADGLLLHYTFDEPSDTRVLDSSGNGRVGFVRGGATRGPGKLGTALVFDGVDDDVTAAVGSLDMSKRFTLAFWFRAEVPATDYSPRMVTRENGWDVKLNTGRPQFQSGSNDYAVMKLAVPYDEWHHLAYVFDAGDLSIYYDGVLAPIDDSYQRTDVTNGTTLFVGSFYGTDSFWKGALDDLRIYDRPLSAAEVALFVK